MGILDASFTGNDTTIKITSILLENGDSPFLYDDEGNRLAELVWCNRYINSQNVLAYVDYYTLEHTQRVYSLLVAAMKKWSRKIHFKFPPRFKKIVMCFLLVNRRLRATRRAYICKDVMGIIFSWLAIADADDEFYLRQTLRSFKVRDIKSISSDKHLVEVKGKGKKQQLINRLLKFHKASNIEDRKIQSCAKLLPEVIGRLTATETTTRKTFKLDIPHPHIQPWVHIGRSHDTITTGICIDMDLSGIIHARKVSRYHFSVKYNITTSRWAVKISGRNGLQIDTGNVSIPACTITSNEWIDLPQTCDTFHLIVADLSFSIEDLIPARIRNRIARKMGMITDCVEPKCKKMKLCTI